MLLAAASGDPQLVAKLGPAATHDWTGFLLAAAQITGAGGLLGFGVVLSWMFGREFGDGTITGLFALPVRRSTIALAKLLIYTVWAIAISLSLAALLVIVGLVAGLGPLTAETWSAVARQIALTCDDRGDRCSGRLGGDARTLRARGRERLDRNRRRRTGLRARRDRGMDAARIPSPVGDLIR